MHVTPALIVVTWVVPVMYQRVPERGERTCLCVSLDARALYGTSVPLPLVSNYLPSSPVSNLVKRKQARGRVL